MNTAPSQQEASNFPRDEQGAGHLPTRFDPGVAHPARVYSFWLGGKDHYPADRAAGQEVARFRPQVIAGVRANRAFGCRVTGHAAGGLGIRQFLDIGAGLPAPGPTHEIAQKISPACRVVYADNDPLVLAHGRARWNRVPQERPRLPGEEALEELGPLAFGHQTPGPGDGLVPSLQPGQFAEPVGSPLRSGRPRRCSPHLRWRSLPCRRA